MSKSGNNVVPEDHRCGSTSSLVLLLCYGVAVAVAKCQGSRRGAKGARRGRAAAPVLSNYFFSYKINCAAYTRLRRRLPRCFACFAPPLSTLCCQQPLLHSSCNQLYVHPLPTMNSRSAVAALAVAGMACCVLDQWSLPLLTRAKCCAAVQYTTRFLSAVCWVENIDCACKYSACPTFRAP